jgi:hypothetical protein
LRVGEIARDVVADLTAFERNDADIRPPDVVVLRHLELAVADHAGHVEFPACVERQIGPPVARVAARRDDVGPAAPRVGDDRADRAVTRDLQGQAFAALETRAEQRRRGDKTPDGGRRRRREIVALLCFADELRRGAGDKGDGAVGGTRGNDAVHTWQNTGNADARCNCVSRRKEGNRALRIPNRGRRRAVCTSEPFRYDVP